MNRELHVRRIEVLSIALVGVSIFALFVEIPILLRYDPLANAQIQDRSADFKAINPPVKPHSTLPGTEQIGSLFLAKGNAKKEAQKIPATLPTVAQPSLILRAVIIQSNEQSILLETGQAGELIRVSLGDEVSGWKISKVSTNYAELSRGTERKKLWLPDVSLQDQLQ